MAATGAPDPIYTNYLVVLALGFVGLTLYRGLGTTSHPGATAPFRAFQRQFLLIYLIMMAADWMQGPYVYKLYSYYGYSRHDNGVLFIAGFGSSLLFGTWAGPMADRYGRKLNCILYGVAYILSCATKFYNDYYCLMVGRLLGGFATSILWSAFESWMVSEHLSRGFDPKLIGSTFSYMIAGNGIVAILSGFVAQWSVDWFAHPVAPFAVSAVFLLIGTALITCLWTENYGDRTTQVVQQMRESFQIVQKDRTILLVGLQQALFEGAMYTFVFLWTPALEASDPNIPHGKIFSCFMIACSIGGSLFGVIEGLQSHAVLMRAVYFMAALTMSVPTVIPGNMERMGAFIVFEICVGMFWPGIGTLRSKYLPESHRATIINVFRIPLNAIVCGVLYFQGGMTVMTVFVICTLFHVCAVITAHLLTLEPAKTSECNDEV